MADVFGDEHQSPEYKQKVRDCLNKWEDEEIDMVEVWDTTWKGFIAFFENSSSWVDCDA
jgi:hypothetical protein